MNFRKNPVDKGNPPDGDNEMDAVETDGEYVERPLSDGSTYLEHVYPDKKEEDKEK